MKLCSEHEITAKRYDMMSLYVKDHGLTMATHKDVLVCEKALRVIKEKIDRLEELCKTNPERYRKIAPRMCKTLDVDLLRVYNRITGQDRRI